MFRDCSFGAARAVFSNTGVGAAWQVDGTEDGIEMMLGDNGVSCKLSKRLPDYVKTNVSDFVDEVRTFREWIK